MRAVNIRKLPLCFFIVHVSIYPDQVRASIAAANTEYQTFRLRLHRPCAPRFQRPLCALSVNAVRLIRTGGVPIDYLHCHIVAQGLAKIIGKIERPGTIRASTGTEQQHQRGGYQ
jgi:hypothetical protein